MSKIIKPEEEETNWRCSCGALNSNEDRFCDCGKRKDEDNVEISEDRPKRMIPY